MPTAITSQGLSKCYRIGERKETPDTLIGAIKSLLSTPYNRFKALQNLEEKSAAAGNEHSNTFWALKDVSFQVNRGDVVGIMGRNGAGKSTLLKILSRITEPTLGLATINGRVSSLLEVGTGFHPELSGRDNIYMNGTILGMKKAEIDRKFEEIVEFSGVSKFLDTPTKRYSSGMRVRLAFAVAANLEPEVLIVDEVLAVGDLEFQKKCLGKMKDVASGGRTVLFVSHNIAAMEALCDNGIVLEKGALVMTGEIDQAISTYRTLVHGDAINIKATTQLTHTRYLKSVTILNSEEQPVQFAETSRPLSIRLGFHTNGAKLHDPRVTLGFNDLFGNRVMTLEPPLAGSRFEPKIKPETTIQCHIPEFPLAPGRYAIEVQLKENREFVDVVPEAHTLEVEDCDLFDAGRGFTVGMLTTRTEWSFKT